MKNYLIQYLRNISRAGIQLHFSSASCCYGKFIIYCLLGPAENIIHLSFAPDKHERAQKQLTSLDNSVEFHLLQQEKFPYNAVFHAYFTGSLTTFPMERDSPFLGGGTPFQQRVWYHIAAIPYGSCITYRQLAERVGSPNGYRAVGLACGANPLALIIPCHRVIGQNSPGGFAGGAAVKESLLALEQARRG